MSTLQIIICIICALLFGAFIGFFTAVFIKGKRAYKASGILHIKQTPDKDYYTIEVTDNLESLASRKAIILEIDSREINTYSNEH